MAQRRSVPMVTGCLSSRGGADGSWGHLSRHSRSSNTAGPVLRDSSIQASRCVSAYTRGWLRIERP